MRGCGKGDAAASRRVIGPCAAAVASPLRPKTPIDLDPEDVVGHRRQGVDAELVDLGLNYNAAGNVPMILVAVAAARGPRLPAMTR